MQTTVIRTRQGIPVASDFAAGFGAPLVGDTDTGIVYWYANSQVVPVSPTADIRGFGAKADGVSNDAPAIQTAINAVSAAGGGVVKVPRGTYYLGTAASGPLLTMPTGVQLVGDGMGATLFTYSSLGRTGATGSGAAIYVTGHYVSLKDFTLSDLNTSGAYGGAGMSGIYFRQSNNSRIERVECLNIKGNGAITYVGNGPSNNYNFWLNDCVVTGTLAGGYVDGDGINVGELRGSYICRNVISGTLRHGFEGGGNCEDQWIVANKVDLQNQGQDGIVSLSGSRGWVLYNSIVGVAANRKAIAFSNDLNTVPIKYWKVAHNKTEEVGGGIGIFFATVQAGTAASLLGPIEICNNSIKAEFPVVLDVATTISIHDNTFDADGVNNIGAVGSSTTNPAIDAADCIDVYSNSITNFASGVKMIQFQGSNWKSPRLRIYDNRVGNTAAAANNGQVDSHVAVTYAPGSITAAAMSSATQTTAFTGLLATDRILVSTDTNLPVGCFVVAQPTGGDSFDWRVINASGSDQTVSSTVFRFSVRRV